MEGRIACTGKGKVAVAVIGSPQTFVCESQPMNCEQLAIFEDLGVRLFTSPVVAPSPREQGAISKLLSEDERRRFSGITHEGTRHEFLITRWLVRTTLGQLGEVDPASLRFTIGAHGRPSLANPPAPLRQLDFNIAHSRQRIVVALASRRAVGVDLEPANRRVDHDLVARRFFHPREQQELMGLELSRRRRRFLELWVLKEAWLKADGRGLSAGLPRVIFSFEHPAGPRLVSLPEASPDAWQVALRHWEGHLLALAVGPGR